MYLLSFRDRCISTERSLNKADQQKLAYTFTFRTKGAIEFPRFLHCKDYANPTGVTWLQPQKNKSHNLQQSLWQCSGEMDNFRILMYNLPAEVHEDRTEVQASIRLGALPFHFRETNAAMYKQDQFLPFTTAESSSFYKLRSAEGASLCNYVASLM